MPISCGANVAKCFLVYFNGFFWLMGAVLLVFGVLFRSNASLLNLSELISAYQNVSLFAVFAYVLLGTGTALFAVSLLGCCGAVRENKACLAVYAVMICTVIVTEGVGAHFFIEELPSLTDNLELNLKRLVKNYETRTMMGKALDYVQIKYECCGEAGPRDYQFSRFWNESRGQIPTPYSCCKIEEPEDLQFCEDCERPRYINDTRCAQEWNETESLFINVQGCSPHLLNFIFNYKPMIIGVGAGFLAVQFLGVIFAIWLCVAKPAIQEEKSEIELPILTRRKTGKVSQGFERTSASQPKPDIQKIGDGENVDTGDSDETQEQSTAMRTTPSSSRPDIAKLSDTNV